MGLALAIVVLCLGCGSERKTALRLQEEYAELRRENTLLRERIAKSEHDHLAVAKSHLVMVTNDQAVIDKFTAAAKRISGETGLAEDIVLHQLADSWQRELWQREREAINNGR
jgi:hypothetical protein